MAGWRPLKRGDFIRKLYALGFDGPYSGTRHQFMTLVSSRQTIPSNREYSVPQIRMLLLRKSWSAKFFLRIGRSYSAGLRNCREQLHEEGDYLRIHFGTSALARRVNTPTALLAPESLRRSSPMSRSSFLP